MKRTMKKMLSFGLVAAMSLTMVDYFYHEEVRGSENTGRRNPQK